MQTTDEDEYFPPPPELRELLRSLGIAASLTHGAPLHTAATASDRQATATDMLIGASGASSS